MASLKEFMISTLGDDATLSLLAAAEKLGFDGSFSAREFMASAESDVEGDFTTLPIETKGSGDWRADRFRIYFFVQGLEPIPVTSHFFEFGRLFPQIFNGAGDEVDGIEGIKSNIATTFYRNDKPVNGEPTLQFTIDARVLFNFINAPDLHDDWVGFVHEEGSNFAVQTLKRNFIGGNDVTFGIATAEALFFAGFAVAGPVGANPFLSIGGGITAFSLNRYHFLAGRRSWRIGQLDPVTNPLVPDQQGLIFFLETAAIDRFSSWVIDLATLTGQVGLGDVDVLTADTWKILLQNYAAFGVSKFSYRTDISAWEEEIADRVGIPFARRENGVFIDQGSFPTKQDCLGSPWVQQILNDHPGIAAQF